MRDKMVKSRACGSHLELSNVSQEKSPDRLDSKSTELPPNQGEQSSVGEDPAQGTAALHPRKQQLDAVSTDHPLPSEELRLTHTDAQPGIGLWIHNTRLHTRQHSQASEGSCAAPSTSPTSSFETKVHGPAQVSPTTPWRNQQRRSDGGDNEYQRQRVRLTWENLTLFDKMTGNKETAQKSPIQLLATTTTATTSGFGFEAHANGMLEPRRSKPPTNLEDIYKRLASSHTTASPPKPMYQNYVDRIEGAINEATIVVEVSRKLLNEYSDLGYKSVFNHAFANFPKDVGFNNGLPPPQPGFLEGLEAQEYLPFPVYNYTRGAVLHKCGPNAIALPHLAGEFKGPGKDMKKAQLQSRYDGAALVYARNEALSLLRKPDPPGHAEVITFTTDGTNLNFFAHYAALSEYGTVEYHQYLVMTAALVASYQGYKDGLGGLRNAQDHARELSYTMRDQLNEYWKQCHGGGQKRKASSPLASP
ncbi:hypothetical protein EDB81DRAFT_674350 [Dactylonectria macrodidyma]|uniref:Uncharacterized protein n=1 Tax=Dactylonectria macrodidyma TaxID=307937 RepID=A0A9P9JN73_9HYPO|nr:hypothetical protein EDB81DRAFT_674350 [Dactylonectria macrodidyma]